MSHLCGRTSNIAVLPDRDEVIKFYLEMENSNKKGINKILDHNRQGPISTFHKLNGTTESTEKRLTSVFSCCWKYKILFWGSKKFKRIHSIMKDLIYIAFLSFDFSFN